jgi:hypothetical protein
LPIQARRNANRVVATDTIGEHQDVPITEAERRILGPRRRGDRTAIPLR